MALRGRPNIRAARIIAYLMDNEDVNKAQIYRMVNVGSATDFSRLMAKTKDIAWLNHRMAVLPVVERPGWWTCRPTGRVIMKALAQAVTQETTRHARMARITSDVEEAVMTRFTADAIAGLDRAVTNAMESYVTQEDECLRRIDGKILLTV